LTKFGHFGPKILIFMGVSKSFGTNITEKPPGRFVWIFFGRRGSKWAKNADNWPKMPVLGRIFEYPGL